MSAFVAGSIAVDLKSQLNDFINGMKRGQNVVDSFGSNTNRIVSKTDAGFLNLGRVADFAFGTLIAGAIGKATSSLQNFFTTQLDSAKNLEATRMAFDGLLGSSIIAGKVMDDIVKEAAKTPFEIPELAESGKMLAAFGVEAKDIVPSIRMVGDVAAGLNVPIKDMAYLVGTIKTQGRAMTADLNQFANRGVPIWKELGKITGLNGEQLRKYAEEGKVTYDTIEQIFGNLTKEGGQFYGMMARLSKTLNGLISTTSDAFEGLGRKILGMTDSGEIIEGQLFDRIRNSAGRMIDVLNSPQVTEFAFLIGQSIGAVGGFIDSTAESVKQLNIYLTPLKDLFNQFVSNGPLVESVFAGVGSVLAVILIPVVWNAVTAMYAFAASTIAAAWPFVLLGVAVASLYYAYKTNFMGIKDAVDNAFSYFLNTTWPWLQKTFNDLKDVLIPAIMGRVQTFSDFWNKTLWPEIQKFIQYIQPGITNLQNLFKLFVDNALPVLQQFADFFMQYIYPTILSFVDFVGILLGVLLVVAMYIFGTIFNVVTTIISNTVNTAITLWGYFGTGITSIFTGIFQFIKGVLDIIVGLFTGNTQRVQDGFFGMFNGLANGLKGIFELIGGALKAAMNTYFIDPFNKMIGNLPSEIAGIKIEKPTIPRFEKGVTNFEGGMAYVHAGELLTYLPKGTNVHTAEETEKMLGQNGGGNIYHTWNITGANAQEIMDQIVMLLARDNENSRLGINHSYS